MGIRLCMDMQLHGRAGLRYPWVCPCWTAGFNPCGCGCMCCGHAMVWVRRWALWHLPFCKIKHSAVHVDCVPGAGD